jgi:hypothetical protein
MIITIPFKAYSVNSMYNMQRKHGMKADARIWCSQVLNVLDTYDQEFQAFRADFDPMTHGLVVHMTFYYNNFYTKAGELNSKVFDLSNLEKPLLDLVCGEDYYGNLPYLAKNLKINDKHVTTLVSEKRPTQQADYITVQITKEPLERF